jgi:hypothetical protein
MLAVSLHAVSHSHIPARREDGAILGSNGLGSSGLGSKEHQDIHRHDAGLQHLPGRCQDFPEYSKYPA